LPASGHRDFWLITCRATQCTLIIDTSCPNLMVGSKCNTVHASSSSLNSLQSDNCLEWSITFLSVRAMNSGLELSIGATNSVPRYLLSRRNRFPCLQPSRTCGNRSWSLYHILSQAKLPTVPVPYYKQVAGHLQNAFTWTYTCVTFVASCCWHAAVMLTSCVRLCRAHLSV